MNERGRYKLGVGEQPVLRRRYVHMMAEDVIVWEAYLRSGESGIVEVWYDVHVGRPVEVLEGLPEYLGRVAAAVSRKRIDVVARVGSGYWAIELKPFGNMVGVGQALMYRDLLVGDYDLDGPVEAVVMCGKVDTDVVEIAAREGVRIVAMEGVLL